MASWISRVRFGSAISSLTRAVATRISMAGTMPWPSARLSSRCEITPLEDGDELQPRLLLLVRREERDDPVDGLDRVHRVQRREHEVAGLGRGHGDLGGLEVAHLAHQDHVGILPQGGAQRLGEARSCRTRPRAG